MHAHGFPHPSPGAPRRCPDCAAPLGASGPECPNCGLGLVGPTAQRLWWIDAELSTLHGRERVLVQERSQVLGRLRWESDERVRRLAAAPAPPPPIPERARAQAPVVVEVPSAPRSGPSPSAPRPAAGTPSGPAPGPRSAPEAERGAEVSRRSAQNVILGLGGLLIGVAALVFAIWTWSDMGTGARAAVLGATTLSFAGLALPLHRRGLRATAETFGSVAAALLCVDALALWLLSDRTANGPGYTAAALAVMSALLVLYPALVPLRTPRVLAVLFAQPVPVLLVVSLPGDGNPGWLLPVVAATALADLVAARFLGAPRPGVPVRTLRAAAVVLWVLVLVVTVVSVLVVAPSSPGRDPLGWWSLATTLLLAGVAGLLLHRWHPAGSTRARDAHSASSVVGLAALALAPLVAGPAHLPVLPRPTTAPWGLEPSAMTHPAVELLGLERASTLPPLSFVYLAGVLAASALALGVVRLLLRSSLPVLLSLVAPAALLAPPLLLGLPLVVTVVWALVLGGALVLGSALHGRWAGAVPVVTGTLTLVTGLIWALPERYTTLAAVLMLAATALVCTVGARVFSAAEGRPAPGGRAATLYLGGALLWALALIAGTAFLLWNRGAEGTAQAQWWMLTAAALLCAATALTLGRVPAPAPSAHVRGDDRSPSDPRWLFTLAGLALLPAAPLLALPGDGPGLPLLPGTAPWSAPTGSVWGPAHTLLGAPAPADLLTALGTALGVLFAGALVLGLVAVVDRRCLTAATALVAPTALVPLPVLLGAPFLVAVVWAALIGAALFLWTPRVGAAVAWLPGTAGPATVVLALVWSLPERHATLTVLLVASVAVAVSAWGHRGPTSTDRGGRVPATALVRGLTAGAWSALLALASTALVAVAVGGASGTAAWWLLGAVTLALGSTALVLGRADRRPDGTASALGVTGLVLLAAVPPVAGALRLPTLPALGPGGAVFGAPFAAVGAPASTLVGLPVPSDTLTALLTAAGLLGFGALSLGSALLFERRLAGPLTALAAPLTLVPLPVLLGAPFLVAVVWTVLVGAALFLWAARPGTSSAPLAGATGLATLLLALGWSLPQQHTALAVLLALAVVTLVSVLPHRRRAAGTDGSPGAFAYGLTTAAWALTLAMGLGLLAASVSGGDPGPVPRWLLGATALVLGASALALGRTGRPPVRGGDGSVRGTALGWAGAALLALAPVVAVSRALPVLAPFSRSHALGGAPLSALTEPAHAFLGVPGPTGAADALASALGLLAAGSLALLAALLVDRSLLVRTAALVVPVALVPVPVVLGLPFLVALPLTLAVGAPLLVGAALLRDGRAALLPWWSGAAVLALAYGWALSERHATVAVLLAAAAVLSVVTALARTRFVAVASTSVSTAATGGFALTVPLLLGAPLEYAALGPLAVVAAVAAVAPRLRAPLVTAAEVPAAGWAAVTLLLSVFHGGRLELVAAALAVVGVISLASAVRPGRRWYAGVGAGLMFAALWTALASWEVTVPEAYTAAPALAFLAIGGEWSRRSAEPPSSWLAYAGGLALLLGPTVWEVLTEDALVWRVPAVLAVGLAVVVWGLRQRLSAALALGGLALLVTSLRAFGPPLWELGQMTPNWLPFAVVGALLLFVGARYEASLTRLRRVRQYLARLR
ncbi:SCO7613 C-terminal domain-containing membrane protein [Nocardiopsis sp. NPDC006938]|uniref:SCO7613 C-terminal domain-containing membrane protein n=1 Tax=Nocardiopsis sp. NPDC006938 TaxID=3364337 RepID=UPI0036743202